MKRLTLTWVLLLAAGVAQAQSSSGAAPNETSDTNASCNASFHVGCQQDSGSTLSSSGFAAPAGVLGGSLPESASLLAMVALVLVLRWRRTARSDAKKQQSTPDDSRDASR